MKEESRSGGGLKKLGTTDLSKRGSCYQLLLGLPCVDTRIPDF